MQKSASMAVVIFTFVLSGALSVIVFLALLPHIALIGAVMLGAGVLLIGYGVIFLIRFGELHLASKKHTLQVIHLTEHGAYVRQGRQYTPLFPASVHVASHQYNRVRVIEAENEHNAPALPAPALAVPTLAELLATRQITPDEPESILGYTDDQPRTGPWAKLHSFMALGMSGSGKSSTVSYYTALAVLHGARLLVIDPDAEEDDSLVQRLSALSFAFLCPPGIDVKSASYVLDIAERELESPGGYPVVWCVDEFSTIMRAGEKDIRPWCEVADRLAANVENWAQRGRKRKRTVIAIGQIGKASRTGGTELRASMTATFVHRLSAQQARLVLDGPDAKACPTLDVGEVVVLLSNSPETYRMHIPYTTPDDMLAVARLMGGNAGNSLETAYGEDRVIAFPLSSTETPPSLEVVPVTGNGIRETINRMYRKGMKHREIAPLVGLGGRKYSVYQDICREEGIPLSEQEV